nr:RNA-directed DNA polymerase, eukaryota [Tanacetum cinerariifolium]
MSLFMVPKTALNKMEGMRRNFFNGMQDGERKIAWVKWSKVLAAKKHGGLGVSSFFALNRALLVKWLKYLFPRLYALESIKESSVADNLQAHIASSFRRAVRGGVETQQLNHFLDLLGLVILSNMEDRWV